jgi:hypothetical protein
MKARAVEGETFFLFHSSNAFNVNFMNTNTCFMRSSPPPQKEAAWNYFAVKWKMMIPKYLLWNSICFSYAEDVFYCVAHWEWCVHNVTGKCEQSGGKWLNRLNRLNLNRKRTDQKIFRVHSPRLLPIMSAQRAFIIKPSWKRSKLRTTVNVDWHIITRSK